MTKLSYIDPVRHNAVAARAPTPAKAPSRGAARQAENLATSVRFIGKTVILAIEVVEIVGFGLALL
jgi:hypothetical protein